LIKGPRLSVPRLRKPDHWQYRLLRARRERPTCGGNDRKMKGNDYLQQFALPNFFFFVTTAYNMLRHRGVPLGKRDFLGPVNWL
jgi:hypothetical protein